MTEGANMDLVREWTVVGNRAAETGQLDDWQAFFSEEIVWEAIEDAPDAGTYRGHAGIRGYFEDWLSTIDGFRRETVGLTEVGDDFVIEDARLHARIKGTDNEMVLDYSQAMLIEDGKIAHIKEFREHDDAVAYAQASKPRQS